MVYFKVSRTGAFYRSSSEVTYSGDTPKDGSEERTFLALYQTDRSRCIQYPEFKDNVRRESELWGDANTTSYDVGGFLSKERSLVEILGSYEHNEGINNNAGLSLDITVLTCPSRSSTTHHSCQDNRRGSRIKAPIRTRQCCVNTQWLPKNFVIPTIRSNKSVTDRHSDS